MEETIKLSISDWSMVLIMLVSTHVADQTPQWKWPSSGGLHWSAVGLTARLAHQGPQEAAPLQGTVPFRQPWSPTSRQVDTSSTRPYRQSAWARSVVRSWSRSTRPRLRVGTMNTIKVLCHVAGSSMSSHSWAGLLMSTRGRQLLSHKPGYVCNL